MNIHKKLNKVMQSVAFVTKNATVGSGSYAYKGVTHDKVTEIVRPFFIDVGIITYPVQVNKGLTVDGKTKNGADKIRFEALYDVHFVDCDDDSEVVVRVEAHAEGSDDKCAGKALSYAVKQAMLKVLMLETGENDEEGLKNSIDAKQTVILTQLMLDTKTDPKAFCDMNNITQISDLPSGLFTSILIQLQQRQKALKEKK